MLRSIFYGVIHTGLNGSELAMPTEQPALEHDQARLEIPITPITDHGFRPGQHPEACGFTYWQAIGPWLICDYPASAHGDLGSSPDEVREA